MAIQTRNTAVTVGVASTSIAPATSREKRKNMILTNDSDEAMYLAVDADAVLNTGIRLDPGDSIVIEEEDDLNASFNGICASGGKSICVFERYLDAL